MKIIEELYKDKITELFKENGIEAAYLFGSYAKDAQGPLSDIDIAILLSDKEKQNYLKKKLFFINELTKILHKNELEVVILNEAAPALKFNIIKDGRLLYSGDERRRVHFESRTMIDYIDTAFLRETYNRYLFKNIKDGKA